MMARSEELDNLVWIRSEPGEDDSADGAAKNSHVRLG